jgi:glycine cleavage system transcriptional repressor
MNQLIAISANGNDRTGLVYDLTRVIVECGGNILESRMTALGNEFAVLMLVGGNWHTLAKLEGELTKLGESSGLTITITGPTRDLSILLTSEK